MNDLKNGVLDINGFLVGPNTTVEELEGYFGIKATKSKNFSYRFFDMGEQEFLNNGITFKVFMSFDKKLDDIVLYPQIPELIEKFGVGGFWRRPSTGDPDKNLVYFREVRDVLDAWLDAQIGTPTRKNEGNTTYEFENVVITTSSYLQKIPHGIQVEGGKVTIRYE